MHAIASEAKLQSILMQIYSGESTPESLRNTEKAAIAANRRIQLDRDADAFYQEALGYVRGIQLMNQ